MRTLPFVSGKTVFLVDDESLNLLCFGEVLSGAGYDVRTAKNGEFALRSIQKSPPDLVILDVKMPGINGYQVYDALQRDESTRNIPVIFLSGVDPRIEGTENLAPNHVDYLLKPIDIRDLLTHVAQVLQPKID